MEVISFHNYLFTNNKKLIFKELELIIFYVKLFLALKINFLYPNCVMLNKCYISFACIFKNNYIRIYVRDKLNLLKEFMLFTSNLYNKIIKD